MVEIGIVCTRLYNRRWPRILSGNVEFITLLLNQFNLKTCVALANDNVWVNIIGRIVGKSDPMRICLIQVCWIGMEHCANIMVSLMYFLLRNL